MKPRIAYSELAWLGLIPALVFLFSFFLMPVLVLIRRSFFDPSFTLEYYKRILFEPVYTDVLYVTIKISIIVTAACILVGYPIAYAAYSASSRWKKYLILSSILLPFWTSLLVRTFSFMLLLQRKGIVNEILLRLHLLDHPIPMVYNLSGVIIGMTYMLLPYFVLPLYGVMYRVDPELRKAALSLGASNIRSVLSTIVPISAPGLIAGGSLVFLLSIGFFVTPALLGGRKEQMLSMIIESQVNEVLNWGLASALSVFLLVATFLFAGVIIGMSVLFTMRLSSKG